MTNFETDPRFGHLVEEASAAPWLALPLTETLQPYVSSENVDGAVVLIDRTDGHTMNRVFALGLERPATASTIQRIIDVYSESGSHNFLIHLAPMARPTTLPRMLEEHGVKLASKEAVVVREATRMRRPDPFFRMTKISAGDDDAVTAVLGAIGALPESFVELICKSLGQPNWHHFVTMDGAKPYSLSGIYVYGKYAWMAPGWTIPEYRNRGAHSAMIAQSINLASELGCEWITSAYPANVEDRTRSYDRAGFRLIYMRNLYRGAPT